MKVLILGGYGVFGGRLAHLLADLPQVQMLIAGRSGESARRFCDDYAGAATATPLHLDRADIASALAEHRPDLVVDASGPFQHYGEHRYRVIEGCIAAGVDYLDFADAADFVFGVAQFDAAAREAGVFVLSGVSSFPVLTAAVLRELAKDMEIERVEGGIAPSPYAGIGLNVMRAVVGYAGAPVKLTRGGRSAHGVGLGESRRYTVAVPGMLPLRNIRFSLVEVPDLQLLPPEHPAMTDIWIGAGPVPEMLHRLLNLLARARAALRLPSLAPLSPLFYRVLNLMRFGEHRGGMYVRAKGRRDGQPVEASWHLLAEGDDGPYIPSMAIEAIIRKALAQHRPAPGARPATHALELADYAPLFAGRTIHTGRRAVQGDAPVYRQVLGPAFDALPASIRALHDSAAPRSWSGTADIERGRGLLARLIAAINGFPPAGRDVPVRVTFTPDAEGELWTRDFGGKQFASHQSVGKGRDQHLLVERFGPLAFGLALVVADGRMRLVPRRWTAFGIAMPHWLLPRGESFEYEQDGQFRFDVTIALPLAGKVVRYRGRLSPDRDNIQSSLPATP